MHATRILDEADRLMTVCNSCRYCEGLCAVFPAMEMRRAFSDGDLNYLANLCHACGACYVDCQFSPPHEFNVNVPKTLAVARAESYAAYAWPQALSGALARNGLVISIVAALSMAAFILGFAVLNDRSVLFGVHDLVLPTGGQLPVRACLLRVASTEAKLGLPEVKLGIIPATGGLARLPLLVPRTVAAVLARP